MADTTSFIDRFAPSSVQKRQSLTKITYDASSLESTTRPWILIVEDESDHLDILKRRFRRAGFRVTGVDHPHQALVAISHRHFDAALLDASLPEMDGVELMQKLQRVQDGLQVVIHSGYKYPEPQAKRMGAFACLVKPYPFAMIKETMERAIADFKGHERIESDASLSMAIEARS